MKLMVFEKEDLFMKKFSILLIFAVLLMAVSVFGQAEPAATTQPAASGVDPNTGLKTAKLLDFTKIFTTEANLQIRSNKWRIKLSGLSDNPENLIKSDFKAVTVDANAVNEDAKSENITAAFGVRINFAYGYNNDWARISTENPISEYKVTEPEGNGVLKNVGPIQSYSIMVRGLNYMHSLEVRMVDRDGNHKDINFGSLYFNGWKRRTVINPDYIQDKRKREVTKLHLYPLQKPLMRFDSLVVYKSPGEKGGDFVFYITDVTLTYEPYEARILNDINDEKVWGIQEAGDKAKEAHEDLLRFLKYSGSNLEEEYLKEEAARKQAGQ
jgi:hypothetical protein